MGEERAKKKLAEEVVPKVRQIVLHDESANVLNSHGVASLTIALKVSDKAIFLLNTSDLNWAATVSC